MTAAIIIIELNRIAYNLADKYIELFLPHL